VTDVPKLLARARAVGIELRCVGEKLRFRAPKTREARALLKELRTAERPAILRALVAANPSGEDGSSRPQAIRSLAELLSAVEELLIRYVVVPPAGAVAIVLWVAHAHAVQGSDVTPYLHISSPEKRCGKTRLLEVVELLVPRPWRAAGVSEAVLYRRIERDAPTLLLDEVDAVFGRRADDTQGLRALLNAGNRRGAVVSRCVGKGEKLVDFGVFCPKILAGIGTLPDTVADRSIPIRMARRTRSESVARFLRREVEPEAGDLRGALAAWAEHVVPRLRQARPAVPEALDDRAAEGWDPMLAVADVAGGEWPSRSRAAAVALHGGGLETEGAGALLRRANRETFTARTAERLTTADLLGALVDREGEPWGAWWGAEFERGNVRGPAFKLGKLLRPYGVMSRTLRVADGRGKGYEVDDFAEAFARYVPPADDVTTGQPAPDAGLPPSGRRDGLAAVTSSNEAETLTTQALSRCHVVEPGEKSSAGETDRADETNGPCRVCGRRAWWRQPSGLAVCGVCHPPPDVATGRDR